MWKWAEGREIAIYLGSYQRGQERSTETLGTRSLDFGHRDCRFLVDDKKEVEMLALVAAERLKSGTGRLKADAEMTEAAREHARDMVKRGYFSHYTTDGRDAGDRLKEAGVVFGLVGENLAYAPSVQAAHRGLMDSPMHRRNILEPRFGRVAAGVLTSRDCGVMVVENFAD